MHQILLPYLQLPFLNWWRYVYFKISAKIDKITLKCDWMDWFTKRNKDCKVVAH